MTGYAVSDVEQLIALFQAGDWCEVRVESPAVSLLLSIDVAAAPHGGSPGPDPVAADAMASAVQPIAAKASADAAPASGPVRTAVEAGAIDPDWVIVTAPNLGTFYRSPKPGAAPFVEVGQRVEVGAEVCLIEVMKLFTSVRAQIAGTIRHIAATDAELVEGGQALMYIARD